MVTHDISEAISISKKVVVLSARPASIKNKILMNFNNEDLTPFQRRKEAQFSGYFDELWKELNDNNEHK